MMGGTSDASRPLASPIEVPHPIPTPTLHLKARPLSQKKRCKGWCLVHRGSRSLERQGRASPGLTTPLSRYASLPPCSHRGDFIMPPPSLNGSAPLRGGRVFLPDWTPIRCNYTTLNGANLPQFRTLPFKGRSGMWMGKPQKKARKLVPADLRHAHLDKEARPALLPAFCLINPDRATRPDPGRSDTVSYRIPTDDSPVPCVRRAGKKPCHDPALSDGRVRAPRSYSETPAGRA
jgi:hypothetical protein